MQRGVRAGVGGYASEVANFDFADDMTPIGATLIGNWTPSTPLANELGIEFWRDAGNVLLTEYGSSPLVIEIQGDLLKDPRGRYFANPRTGEGVTLAVDQPMNLTMTVRYAS